MLARLLATVIVVVAMLIPTWMFIFAHTLTNPQGFWQNIVLLGAGVYFLGFFQLVLLAMGAIVLWLIWSPQTR